MATTLRRSRKESSGNTGKPAIEDFDKTFDLKYWSYSKSKYPVPLTTMVVEEGDDTPQRLFGSLLVFAGLAVAGGYEMDDDAGFVEMIQNVIGRCLEKEDACNEFYMQVCGC